MVKIKICGLVRPKDVIALNQYQPDYVGFVFAQSKRQVSMKTAMELKQLLAPSILAVGVFVNENIDQVVEICTQNIIDIIQLHGEEDETYIKELRTRTKKPIIKAIRVKQEGIDTSRDIKSEDVKPKDIETVDIETVDIETMDMKHMDMKHMDMKHMDMKHMYIESMDIKPMNMKHTDIEPMDIKPMDIKLVEIMPKDIEIEELACNCDYLLFDTYKEGIYGGCGEVFDWRLAKNCKKPFFLAGGIHTENVVDAIRICNPYCIDVSSGVETEGFKDPKKIADIIAKVRSVG